ncbi:methylamine utilization protein MauJ [Hoeflea sp.]|uniref:methylamine utilization protein MauJ n=1 Tax=Hoeflea sp. TaxID=1940281 RepID=UPI003A8D45F1
MKDAESPKPTLPAMYKKPRFELVPNDQCVGEFPDTRISIETIEATDERLKQIGWIGAHVRASVPWPTKPHLVKFRGFELFLLPAEGALLSAIFVRDSTGADGPPRSAILRFLSIWSWIEGYGIKVETWTGGSRPFRAQGQGGNVISNYPLKFSFWPKNLSREAEIAIALFREAKSLDHTPYSLLSYLKIINLLEKGNSGQRKVIEKYLKEISETRAVKRLDELGTNPDGMALPDYILKACRHAVAHANLTKGYIFDPDNPEDISRLIKDEPIIVELASLVIRREFGVPSKSDNWKSKTHYISGVIWWIGNTTYQRILSLGSVGRRSLLLPKTVDLLVEGQPRKQALTGLQMKVQRVKDGIAILGLSSKDGLLYLEAAIDFNSGRLVFDPMLEHFNLDDGTIRAAERAADLSEFWAEVFLNGVCQLWDTENSKLLAEANAYLPLNCFFDPEGHSKSTEAIQAEIAKRRGVAAEHAT